MFLIDRPDVLPIYFAPLQGFTECAYRQAHFLHAGHSVGESGIAAYYTPFLRVEKGEARSKDLRDLKEEVVFIETLRKTNPQLAEKYRVIPQIICKDVAEFYILVEAIENLNADAVKAGGSATFAEIDINMGCPFPMQAKAGRGSGLLPHPDAVRDILAEVTKRSSHHGDGMNNADADQHQHDNADIKFSVKMRLGYSSPDECMELLPLLNDATLTHVTMHPRLGVQQYKGALDFQAFVNFYKACRHPVIFNGDITTSQQINDFAHKFPNLKGIMLGRGLLAHPALAAEYAADYAADYATEHASPADPQQIATQNIQTLVKIHNNILDNFRHRLQGDAQVLDKIRPFWTYPAETGELPKRTLKKIEKARTLVDYCQAVNEL